MIIINFSHPLTEDHKKQIENLIQQPITDILEANVQVRHEDYLEHQVGDIIKRLPLSAKDWQTAPIIVNLPGYAPIAACLLAEIEGRRGHLPSIIKTRPVVVNAVTSFEVYEVVNLQQIREKARIKRLS